jgi:predicted DNA-binding transcriptional regulator AlpA
MPSALARKSVVTNPSHENVGGQQLRSQQSITSVLSRPPRQIESGLNWGPNTLEDVTFLRLPEVKAITGLSKSSIYALIRESNFPAPVRVGSRAVAWIRSEIKQWAADRVNASRSAI